MAIGANIIADVTSVSRKTAHIAILTQDVNARIDHDTYQQDQRSKASIAKIHSCEAEGEECAHHGDWHYRDNDDRQAYGLKLDGTDKEHDDHHQQQEPVIGLVVDWVKILFILALVSHRQNPIIVLDHLFDVFGRIIVGPQYIERHVQHILLIFLRNDILGLPSLHAHDFWYHHLVTVHGELFIL